jgi:hypothetical protein
MQKAITKDVQCCFEVFQTHFAIVQNPRRQWNMTPVKSILIGDLILHNMIKKYESNCNVKPLFDIGSKGSHLKWCFFKDYCRKTIEIENETIRYTLWNIFGFNKANNMY